MAATSIEWTDHSVNPIRARHKVTGAVGHYCEKVGAGCFNCYASAFQPRFRMPQFPGRATGEVEPFFDDEVLLKVLHRKKPTKFFWCDMTDLFGRWVPDFWIDCCVAAMLMTPQHTHQVLTKRAKRAREYFTHESFAYRLGAASHYLIELFGSLDFLRGLEAMENVWLGVSAEHQAAATARVPELAAVKAVGVRFVSAEPLLSAIDFVECGAVEKIDWVIFGGESGAKARHCNLDWILRGVEQCRAEGITPFVKQLGASPVLPYYRHPLRDWALDRLHAVYQQLGNGFVIWDHANFGQPSPGSLIEVTLKHPKGGDPTEWPEELRVREYPQIERSLA